ncbi:MAG: NifB/NifX family molybdenum-iron cluster-binding protein [Planctomycetota bacterium]|nr:NifB/NifX family molybdenum-iron cluster-binding protein [Planctomycetota bacterium]
MRIAVTSVGQAMDAQVDPRFGRAACFVVVDTESMEFQAMENSNVDAGGGAGISAAKVVIEADAKAVLTGNCGPNAERTLRAGNVKLYTGVTGTVAEAVEQFKAGKLTEATGPNVQSHSGMNS